MLKEFHLRIKTKRVVIFLLLLLLIYIYINFSTSVHFVFECPIKAITGFYCPGCGITRMFKSFFEGQIYQAFRYNPLVFLLLIFYFIYLILDLFFHKYIKIIRKEYLLLFLLFMTVVYGILRNIPYFSFLQPVTIG